LPSLFLVDFFGVVVACMVGVVLVGEVFKKLEFRLLVARTAHCGLFSMLGEIADFLVTGDLNKGIGYHKKKRGGEGGKKSGEDGKM
jgi:hypothetical protein